MTKIVRQFIMFNDQAVSCFRKEFFDNGEGLSQGLDFENKTHCKKCMKEYKDAR